MVDAMYLRAKVYQEDERFLRFLLFSAGNIDSMPDAYCMTVNVFCAGLSGWNLNTALGSCANAGIGTCSIEVNQSVHTNFYIDGYLMFVAEKRRTIFSKAASLFEPSRSLASISLIPKMLIQELLHKAGLKRFCTRRTWAKMDKVAWRNADFDLT